MKKKTISKLKKDLDTIFSQFVRLRDADENGYVKCITCGKARHWKDSIDAGHYISRSFLSTRFDERNVHAQCKGCNSFGGGRPDEYALFLQKKYGGEILQELNNKKHKLSKIMEIEYEAMIDHYKTEVKKLKSQKA